MNVSLNWLKNYLDISLDAEKVGEVLTEIGLEVEGMEEVESIKGGLHGVVVGHVKECGKHPDADRLSVTKVDVGGDEDLSIVCGAPNVAAGQKVLVATVGTVLYPGGSDEPLKLKKGKIRGQVSEGMICAEDELGLGNSHDGIMVLPEDTAVGTTARDYFSIDTDTVYEIGLTPNRSDATNHLGVAKDLAAALKTNYDHSGDLCIPSVDDFKVDNNNHPVDVVVEDAEACPRYAGLTITGLTIKESPDWLKKQLNAIGVRPISNIVDITNFILHELGQPLHAFDLNAITDNKIIVKKLPAGTKFTTLDEVERTLRADDLMICDGQENGMCIGGVFGGMKSGVTDETTAIFLEAAHFDAQTIRRTSMSHNLRTDAAKVFEKGSDPNIAVYALKRAAMLIKELAGGEISSEVIDLYPNPIKPVEVEVAYAYVNRLIGVDISKDKIKEILAALEMDITAESDTTFTVAVPTNKADVTRPADVVEEILRIYGFNKVEVTARINTALGVGQYPDPGTVRNKIGDYLAANGFFEMMAVSLSQSGYYEQYKTPVTPEQLVYINNTSNVQLDIMRPDMLFSGLEAILHNQNRQTTRLKLFEFGRSYQHAEKGINERDHLSIFVSGDRQKESWITAGRKSDYYTLKAFVTKVLARLGMNDYQRTAIQDEVFAYGQRYHRGPQVLVEFGKVNGSITKAFGIREDVFFANFEWNNLIKGLKKHRISYEPVNKFPSTRRDLALVIDNSVKFDDIVAIARKTGKKLLTEIDLFDVYENAEQLGENKRSYAISFIFEDPNKTLKDKDVDKVMNKLISEYENKLGAGIRR